MSDRMWTSVGQEIAVPDGSGLEETIRATMSLSLSTVKTTEPLLRRETFLLTVGRTRSATPRSMEEPLWAIPTRRFGLLIPLPLAGSSMALPSFTPVESKATSKPPAPPPPPA